MNRTTTAFLALALGLGCRDGKGSAPQGVQPVDAGIDVSAPRSDDADTASDVADAGSDMALGTARDAAPDGLAAYDAATDRSFPFGLFFRTIWGTGPKDVWVGAEGGVLRHWDGDAWTDHQFPGGCDVVGLWGAAPDDYWAVGCATIAHWKGARWEAVEAPTRNLGLNAVHGTAPDDVWAGGQMGSVLHWNGVSWTAVNNDTSHEVECIWARTRDDAWLVGGQGFVRHWNGSTWKSAASYDGSLKPCIFAAGATDVWAGGHGFARFDGDWSVVDVEGLDSLFADITGLFGRSSSDIWAADSWSGAGLHYDGTKWSVVKLKSKGTINDVWNDGAGETWFVGIRGFIERVKSN